MTSLPKTMQAIRIEKQGGIEELQKRDDVELPSIQDNEILIKTEWTGVNFIDTYQRGGVYPVQTPAVLGNEPSGEVVKLGAKVDPSKTGYNVGDKVATYSAMTGYGQYSRIASARAMKLPEGITTKMAAAATLQGLTALTAVREAHEVKSGQWICVHAAAGGLGLLLCQMATALGANVIGTTSTEEKADLAKKAGAKHVVLYKDTPFEEVAKKIYDLADGQGCHAVYDGVGKDTFEADFTLLRRKGTLVTIGNASGAVPPFSPLKLAGKNIKVVRPTLNNYVFTQEEFQTYTSELFDMIKQGKLDIKLHKEEGYQFTTEDVQQAHKDISGRGTTGKLIIKVA